jgi:hypothetical protein
VKSSGRDDPIQVVIHMCMEAMLKISLYNSPYLKLAKMLCPSYYFLCLVFIKIREEGRKVLPGNEEGGEEKEWEGCRGETSPNNVCTYA